MSNSSDSANPGARTPGYFAAGDRIQLTDPKGKLYSFTLTPGKEWHTHKGWIVHDELIGLPEGSVVSTTAGLKFTAFIPLLSDYVLSMPRGATIVYPKDAAMIIGVADVYPGVRETLQQFAEQGLPMACLTNKPLSFARSLLKEKSLDRFFQHVFGGDSFERKKPDPLPILKTCEALCTPMAKTLMVGDSSNDAQAAHAAGCPVVLVTYGYNHGQRVQDTPAAAWLDSLAALPAHLSAV